MMNVAEQINIFCYRLAQEIPCDFVGVAIFQEALKELQWKYAVGNRNTKYEFITVRYGKGIAGSVMRTGRPMSIANFPFDIIGKPTDYPIMLAEKLVSAMATPIKSQEIAWGVLLVGNRNRTTFTSEQLLLLQNWANKVSQCQIKSA